MIVEGWVTATVASCWAVRGSLLLVLKPTGMRVNFLCSEAEAMLFSEPSCVHEKEQTPVASRSRVREGWAWQLHIVRASKGRWNNSSHSLELLLHLPLLLR